MADTTPNGDGGKTSASTDGVKSNPATGPSTDAGTKAKAKTTNAAEVARGTYVVAPGRTVVSGDGETFGPGDEVELTAAEAKNLVLLGFFRDRDGSVLIQADGPAVNVEDGVEVRQTTAG